MLRRDEAAPEFALHDIDGAEWRLGEQPAGVLVLSWIRGEW